MLCCGPQSGFFFDLMMTVYGRNMWPQCNLLYTLYYYIDVLCTEGI